MDEDFYIEETSPKKIFFICLFILVAISLLVGYLYYNTDLQIVRSRDLTIELGDKLPTNISKFLRGRDLSDWTIDVSTVSVDEEGNTDAVGEYSFTARKDSNTRRGKIFVVDTTPPVVETQDLTVGVNEEFDIEDFILSCEDLSGSCFYEYAKEEYYTLNETEGTSEVSIIVKDAHDNQVVVKAILTVKEGASLSNTKAADLEVYRTYPRYEDWDKTFTFKFEKGIRDNSDVLNTKFLEIVNTDYSDKFNKPVKERTNLIAYNRFGFALGISVRLEFEDGEVVFVTN